MKPPPSQRSPYHVFLDLPANVQNATVGLTHSCALTSTSEALCWGDNANGDCGVFSTPMQPQPTPVKLPAHVLPLTIEGYAGFTCMLTQSFGVQW